MKTKAVFFDFDGTITHQLNIDTWKALYMKLGLDTGENIWISVRFLQPKRLVNSIVY